MNTVSGTRGKREGGWLCARKRVGRGEPGLELLVCWVSISALRLCLRGCWAGMPDKVVASVKDMIPG